MIPGLPVIAPKTALSETAKKIVQIGLPILNPNFSEIAFLVEVLAK
jgi:hypothetical protein